MSSDKLPSTSKLINEIRRSKRLQQAISDAAKAVSTSEKAEPAPAQVVDKPEPAQSQPTTEQTTPEPKVEVANEPPAEASTEPAVEATTEPSETENSKSEPDNKNIEPAVVVAEANKTAELPTAKATSQQQGDIAQVKTTRKEAPEVSNIDTSTLSQAKPTVAPVQTVKPEVGMDPAAAYVSDKYNLNIPKETYDKITEGLSQNPSGETNKPETDPAVAYVKEKYNLNIPQETYEKVMEGLPQNPPIEVYKPKPDPASEYVKEKYGLDLPQETYDRLAKVAAENTVPVMQTEPAKETTSGPEAAEAKAETTATAQEAEAPVATELAKSEEAATQQTSTPASQDTALPQTTEVDSTAPAANQTNDTGNNGGYTPTGDYQKDIAAIAAEKAESMRQSADELSDSIIKNAEEEAKASEQAYTLFQEAIADRNKSVAQSIIDYKGEIDAISNELQQSELASRKASRAAAYGELAAAFINLAGVMGGANNAPINHRVSTGWMQQAEEQARERRHRIPSMRDRLRMLQGQLDTLKAGDAESAFKLSREKAQALRKAKDEAAEVKAKAYQQAAGIEADAAATAATRQYVNSERDKRQQALLDFRASAQRDKNYTEQVKALASGVKSNNKIPYHDKNGNLVFANMKSKEYEAFMSRAFNKASKDKAFMELYEDAAHNYEKYGLLLAYAEKDAELRKVLDSYRDGAKVSQEAKKSEGLPLVDYFGKVVRNAVQTKPSTTTSQEKKAGSGLDSFK